MLPGGSWEGLVEQGFEGPIGVCQERGERGSQGRLYSFITYALSLLGVYRPQFPHL